MPVPTRGMFPDFTKLVKYLNEDSIEKPWGFYSLAHLIVRSDHETKGGVFIRTSENQQYPSMFLTHNALIRFSTSEEAIEYICKTYLENQTKVTAEVISHFARAMEQESVQSLHDILIAYRNKRSSLSSPKCTPSNLENYAAINEEYEENPLFPKGVLRKKI